MTRCLDTKETDITKLFLTILLVAFLLKINLIIDGFIRRGLLLKEKNSVGNLVYVCNHFGSKKELVKSECYRNDSDTNWLFTLSCPEVYGYFDEKNNHRQSGKSDSSIPIQTPGPRLHTWPDINGYYSEQFRDNLPFGSNDGRRYFDG